MAAPLRRVAGSVVQLGRQTLSQLWTGHSVGCRCITSTQSVNDDLSLINLFQKATEQHKSTRRPIYKTQENDPANHSLKHEGLFYTVPPEVAKNVLGKGMHIEYYRLLRGLNEMCFMVRQPALELLYYLKESNYSNPVHRYLIYGKQGMGKSTCLAHAMHFCHSQDWITLHVPWGAFWNRYYRETAMSSSRPGRIDLPLDSVEWIQWFKTQNSRILKNLDLKTTSRYVWSKREITEVGTSFNEIIDLGLARSKYASDCVGVILKEIKHQASIRGFKVLVAIDGVNSFWRPTNIKLEDKTFAPASQLTLVHNFKKMLNNDWAGGAVICTVDKLGNQENQREFDTPHYLLDKEGFESFDPFIPIHVDKLSEKEMHSFVDYLIEKKWITNPKAGEEEGRKEILFLSGKNPGQLHRLLRSW